MRLFIFKGLLVLSNGDRKLAVLIDDVFINTSYNDNTCDMVIELEAFEETLKILGYQYDDVNDVIFEVNNPNNTFSTREICQNEEYVYFKGTPLQYTGFEDKLTKPIFEGHRIGGGVVNFCKFTGQWCISRGRKNLPLYRHIESFIEGWDFSMFIPKEVSNEQQ